MRFLQVIDSAVHGGAEVHTRLLSKALLKRNHSVTVACPPGEYLPSFKELEKSGGRIVEVDLKRQFWKGVERLKQIIQAEKPDVVHSHKHRADLACGLATRGTTGIKKISTIHNMLRFDVANPLRRWAYYGPSRWALHHMDNIFTVCGFVADEVEDYFGLARERVTPLVNGIDLEELEDKLRSPANAGVPQKDSELWIGCVGQLSLRKGQDLLIQSFARLAADHPTARLILIGGGPMRKKFNEVSRRAGVASWIVFAGRVPYAPQIIAQCDIYVQPSRWDPVPRAMLEAMALGVPVIASAVTGIPEIIEDDRTGLLIQKENVNQLTASLKKLLQNPGLRKKLGQEGREFVRSHCTMDSIAEEILQRVGGGG